MDGSIHLNGVKEGSIINLTLRGISVVLFRKQEWYSGEYKTEALSTEVDKINLKELFQTKRSI